STRRRNGSSSQAERASAMSVIVFPSGKPRGARPARVGTLAENGPENSPKCRDFRRKPLARISPRRYERPVQGEACRGGAAACLGSGSREGDAVHIACSSLCFASYPLDVVLRTINELQFAKVDLALHEGGPHLRPGEVAADVNRVAQVLRVHNLAFAAFH